MRDDYNSERKIFSDRMYVRLSDTSLTTAAASGTRKAEEKRMRTEIHPRAVIGGRVTESAVVTYWSIPGRVMCWERKARKSRPCDTKHRKRRACVAGSVDITVSDEVTTASDIDYDPGGDTTGKKPDRELTLYLAQQIALGQTDQASDGSRPLTQQESSFGSQARVR